MDSLLGKNVGIVSVETAELIAIQCRGDPPEILRPILSSPGSGAWQVGDYNLPLVYGSVHEIRTRQLRHDPTWRSTLPRFLAVTIVAGFARLKAAGT